MSRSRGLAWNVFSNWTGYAVQVAVTFFLTPLVVGSLGDARYGVWILLSGLTGYYGLLDLGFRAGLTQYLTRYLATKQYDKLNQTASTGFVALACCGLLILLATVLLSWFAPHMFRLAPEHAREFSFCLIIVGLAIGIQFCFFPFSSVLVATERFDIVNGIGICTRVLSAVALVQVLKIDHSLLGISLITAGSNVLDYGLRCVAAYRLVPQLQIRPHIASVASAREFMSFGAWNVVINGSARLISYTHAVIIGLFMPAAAIAPFALAASLRNYFNEMFAPIGQVFFPTAARLDAQGDNDGLRRLYLNVSRLLLCLVVSGAVVAFIYSEDFFRLWVPVFFIDTGPYPSPALLFRILLVAAVCLSGQRIGYQVLLGTHRISVLARLFVAEGILNVVLCICLIPWFGLIGVALGTLIPSCIFHGVIQPYVIARALDVTWRGYFRQVLLKPLVVGAALGPAVYAIHSMVAITNWGLLVAHGFATALLALALIVVIGLSAEERNRFLLRPLEKFTRRRQPADGSPLIEKTTSAP